MAASFIAIRSTAPDNLGRVASSRPVLRVIEGGGASSVVVRRQRVFLLRRALVLVVVLALCALLALVWQSLIGRATEPSGFAAAVPATHQVVEGESLWSIARDLAPESDPRYIVAELAEANGGEILLAGSTLRIPESVREAAS